MDDCVLLLLAFRPPDFPMIGRHLLFVLVLFAAAVVPYLANSSAAKWFSGATGTNAADPAKPPVPGKNDPAGVANSVASPQTRTAGFGGRPGTPDSHLDGGPVKDLAEVLRFDISPRWVMQRWPRVSAAVSTSEPTMQGYRVPVVTGTRPDDIAGSLTYYFTDQQHVRRLAFQGTTGDPRRLIELVTTKYELRPQPPAQPGELLYQVRWNNEARSEMLIKPDRVFRADAPYGRYEVTLEINNFAAK